MSSFPHFNIHFCNAGRKGGETTSNNHDKEFYQDIGAKGGEARAEQRNDNNNSDGSNNSNGNGNGGKMSREKAGRKGGENSN